MKVWEMIARLEKAPAGAQVRVEENSDSGDEELGIGSITYTKVDDDEFIIYCDLVEKP